MSLTYSKLTGTKTDEESIRHWINWDKVPVETVLDEAQSWLFRRIRVREMKTRLTDTITITASSIALPTGWLGPISFYRTGDDYGKITFKEPDGFESHLGYDDAGDLIDGTPVICAIDKANIYFNVKADKAYPYVLWYWQEPTKLSKQNETNFLTTRHPHILRATCMAFAEAQRKDAKERDAWLGYAMREVHEIMKEADLEMATTEYDIHWGDTGGEGDSY